MTASYPSSIVNATHASRRADWIIVMSSMLLSIQIMRPTASMDQRAYETLMLWATEATWGSIIFALGCAHIIALLVNGGKGWTPYLRAVINHICAALYLTIAAGFWNVNDSSTAVPIYASLGLAYFFCGCWAVQDAVRKVLDKKAGANGKYRPA
jgi:hypothetical protein